MYYGYDIDDEIVELLNETECELEEVFKEIEENALLCSAKVLNAFQKNKLAGFDFAEVTGYGYYDGGREKLEKIYADIFKAEDALVRPQIMTGTHALSIALFGLLKYGDTMISISGTPYDSMQAIIGVTGESRNSLIKNGIKYEQIELIDNDFDISAIQERLKNGGVKLVEIQRSCGYITRKSLTIAQIEKVCKAIREVNSEVIIMVDNCYGEFVEDREPIEVGADIIVSSLMKNLGAGICKSGGYVVGRKDLIQDVAEKFSDPAHGKNVGANFNELTNYYKGLFMSPSVVCSALKTMTLASALMEKLGYEVSPYAYEKRTDIIQRITFHSKDDMINFHIGLQKASPVDSFVVPVPDREDGFESELIMASGTFTTGATIELSSDGPVIEPYTAFMQGSLTYEYGKLGILKALSEIRKK